MSVTIARAKITMKDALKTLGMSFDKDLNFKKHWSSDVKLCQSKILLITKVSAMSPFVDGNS